MRILSLFTRSDFPHCQVCHRPVGKLNPIRGKVGTMIVGCATCTPDRRGS
jgi:hypothetical protein